MFDHSLTFPSYVSPHLYRNCSATGIATGPWAFGRPSAVFAVVVGGVAESREDASGAGTGIPAPSCGTAARHCGPCAWGGWRHFVLARPALRPGTTRSPAPNGWRDSRRGEGPQPCIALRKCALCETRPSRDRTERGPVAHVQKAVPEQVVREIAGRHPLKSVQPAPQRSSVRGCGVVD